MSYEKVMSHLSGPISIVAGWLATQLVNHAQVAGSLGFSKDQSAKAIIYGITFVTGAGLTFLGHQKWFTNLSKWWEHQSAGAAAAQPDSAITPDAPLNEVPEPTGPSGV